MVSKFWWAGKTFCFDWAGASHPQSLTQILPQLGLPAGQVAAIVGATAQQQWCGLATPFRPSTATWTLVGVNQPAGQELVQATGCYLAARALWQQLAGASRMAMIVNVTVTATAFCLDVRTNSPLRAELTPRLEQAVNQQKRDFTPPSSPPVLGGFKFPRPLTPGNNIKLFRVLAVSGMRNEHGQLISRLRATALATAAQVRTFEQQLAVTHQYDHRTLGRTMELFLFSPLTGQGLPLWRPRGATIMALLQQYIAQHNQRWDYQPVITPVLGSKAMFTTSGHLQHYQADMFGEVTTHSESFFLRPMTCPHHIMLYQLTGVHSYRDLPLRFAECARLYRYEASGALTGIERTRVFTLPDAHLFLTASQLAPELKRCLAEVRQALADFRLTVTYIAFSLHDPVQTGKYYPAPAMWRRAETVLQRVTADLQVPVQKRVGEAAFYGPKLDFQLVNQAGHEITVATLQLDFMLPARFKLQFAGADGTTHPPIMIHRGLVGSLERLLAVLLEQTRGWLPLWLAPLQVVVIPVNLATHRTFCEQLVTSWRARGMRCQLNATTQRVTVKVRRAQVLRVPYVIMVGNREVTTQHLSVRALPGSDTVTMPISTFLRRFRARLKKKL